MIGPDLFTLGPDWIKVSLVTQTLRIQHRINKTEGFRAAQPLIQWILQSHEQASSSSSEAQTWSQEQTNNHILMLSQSPDQQESTASMGVKCVKDLKLQLLQRFFTSAAGSDQQMQDLV